MVLAGRIFKTTLNVKVNDTLTCDIVEVPLGSHVLVLGRVGVVDHDYEFYLLEEQRIVRTDGMDAAILEISSEEIV